MNLFYRLNLIKSPILNTIQRKCTLTNSKLIELINQGYFSGLLPQRSEKYLSSLCPNSSVYLGVDPSSDSLQLGNLVAIMGLLRCHLAGYKALIVLGTGTALVGDPTDRLTKRASQTSSQYQMNVAGIRRDLDAVLNNYVGQITPNQPETNQSSIRILHNADWLDRVSCLSMVSEISNQFRVSEILDKESVKLRLKHGHGMDMSELLYPVLQAYDFMHLYQDHNCRIQVGGHDQLGNIDLGLTLIERKLGQHAFGLTVPLLTSPDGRKFGKSNRSESQTIWLSPERLLPYLFYQRILNLPDRLVSANLLRQLTFHSSSEIDDLMQQYQRSPDLRVIQRTIAEELTSLVHGVDGLRACELATRVFYPHPLSTSSLDILRDHLSPSDRTHLLNCLQSDSARYLPVIHTKSFDVTNPCRWFAAEILSRATTHASVDQTLHLKECIRKGVVLNDAVLFKPQVIKDTSSIPAVLENDVLARSICDAMNATDPSTGISVLKLGKREHWFVLSGPCAVIG